MGRKIERPHRNIRRAAFHLERLLRFERRRLVIDIVATILLIAVGACGFYFPAFPKLVQVICFACAGLAAFSTWADYRLARSHRGELAQLRRAI